MAIGAYQIMDYNVPVWTKEVLFKRMTPEEFRMDQKAQDAVALYKIHHLLKVYGKEDVAAIWFSGSPLKGNNRMDVNGTSVPEYAAQVVRNYTYIVSL